MRTIRRLDQETIEEIRAGEVIERPASIVKELVENAIDAGAESIAVNIVKGGCDEIVVQDDGIGIHQEDAGLAFERHATSKIRESKDLYQLKSLGFRGEALASIAAVSHVHLVSKPQGELEGVSVRIRNGQEPILAPIGCREGTTVSVRNVFYNSAPRRTFLKSPTAESRHIHEFLIALSLSRPSVAFRFRSDGRDVFSVPRVTGPDQLFLRSSAVLAKRWGKGLVRILKPENAKSEKGVVILGVASSPETTRNTRTGQYFFVNGRYVKSLGMSYALGRGYGELLPARRFPLAALFVTIPPEFVDVNVHPTKHEVKFRDERDVFQQIVSRVRASLDQANLFKKIDISSLPNGTTVAVEREANGLQARAHGGSRETRSARGVREAGPAVEGRPNFRFSRSLSGDQYGLKEQLEKDGAHRDLDGAQPKLIVRSRKPLYRVVGQSHELFVLVETQGELWIVDQHAAHERVTYEQVLDDIRGNCRKVQRLLLPLTFELTPAQSNAFDDVKEYLALCGFSIEPFGGNSYQIQATPSYLRPQDSPDLITELLEASAAGSSDDPVAAREEDLAARIACKVKSIKAGQTLTIEHMEAMVDALLQCRSPFACPHGRPTMVRYALGDLEKLFERR